MSERKPDQAEISAHPDIHYARDLYVQMFEDAVPLHRLGYNHRQIPRVTIALRQLENETAAVYSNGTFAVFSSDDKRYEAFLGMSNLGEWYLRATDDSGAGEALESNDHDFALALMRLERNRIFEQDGAGVIGRFYLFPETIEIENIDTIVKHIYSDEYDKILPDNPLSKVRSKVFSRDTTYRAKWVDDETKLDLVVHIGKSDDFSIFEQVEVKPRVDVWRRLSQQEKDGKIWTPFGKKANTSAQQSMSVFDAKKDTVQGRLQIAPQALH